MATRKSIKREQFLVLSSSCGSFDQAEVVDEYSTLSAAQKAAEAEADSADYGSTYFIAKIVKVGRISGVAWEDA